MSYLRQKLPIWKATLFLGLLSISSTAGAQSYYEDEQTQTNILFQLITGGLGTFVIIFFGLGGLGSLYLTRSGDSAKRTPVLGVVMLLMAGATFAYRVMIRAGMMGHEHIQW